MSDKQTPGPTWYDLLGVAPDAKPEEIKAAWRNATDQFEPGSGTSQFRLFNEAADVLLDPAKRAAYDAELAPSEMTQEATPEPQSEPDLESEPEDGPGTAPETGEPTGLIGMLSRLNTLVVAVIGVLGVALVVLAIVLAVNTQHKVYVQSAGTNMNAGADASAAAARAMVAVLSYDYRHMDADRAKAENFLTPAYQQEYGKTFDLLVTGKDGSVGPAVKTKTVVTANVLSTAVQDADSNQVHVLVFVNQSAVKGDNATPAIFQNRVVATMVHIGDQWLVDKLTSY